MSGRRPRQGPPMIVQANRGTAIDHHALQTAGEFE
jgi:hypothetical protein